MTYISSVLEKNKQNVRVWERTPEGRVCKKYSTPWYLYIPSQNNEKTQYKDLYGKNLRRIEKQSYNEFMEIRKLLDEHNIDVYEGDIRPEYKVLSEHYYNSNIGKLNITFFDIEVDYDRELGFSNPENPYAPISSIAIYHHYSGRTITISVPPPNRKGITTDDLPEDILQSSEIIICKNEKELLELFFEEIEDSDIVSGWNSGFFDIPYVYERAERVLYGGAGNKLSFIGAKQPYYTSIMVYGSERKKLNISGRVHLDYLDVYKKFEVVEKPSYSLEAIAEDEIPDLPKLEYHGSLYELYRNDFEEFLRYNIRDTVILKGLENKKRYIQLAIQMSHMATSMIEDVLGTIKVAECSIINYCHDILDRKVKNSIESMQSDYEGAIVLEPQIGMHDWIASIDIVSLYPSTMRSLNISPETIVGQFANDGRDFEEIRRRSDTQLVLSIDRKQATTIKSAKEWAEQFEKLGLCVSASGTVYNQKVDGVIPLVLTTWFNERKEFKKKMAEAASRGDKEEEEYYNNMQYIKKIALNSMYGACANQFFKFYDVRLARSTTLTARQILLHMAQASAEVLDGEYKYPSKSILYGDTDSVAGSSEININGIVRPISEWFEIFKDEYGVFTNRNKETIKINSDLYNTICYNPETKESEYKEMLTIYRHKVKKPMFRITLDNGKFIDVTEDHSLVVERNGLLMDIKPSDIDSDDIFICINSHRGFHKTVKPEVTRHKISSIREINSDSEYVYDLVMKDVTYPYFTANGVLVHNSIYFSTNGKDKKTAKDVSNKVTTHVNESFPLFMSNAFLCDDTHNTMITANPEIISDRGIFVKKKYYMLHVVDDEGKEVDKMKNMGVPIKKTTLPKPIKVKLESFIKRLLIGEDWNVVGRDVVKFKDELKQIDDVLQIGLPKGIKVIDTYQQRYNAKEPNLRLPGHVAASMMWNSCLEKYGDKESPKIISGEKIYVYYLTRKFDIFKSIAVPKDISVIPDWFNKHFYDMIDRDAQIERLVDKPMEIMISAAGIKVPSKKSILLEEGLFGE